MSQEPKVECPRCGGWGGCDAAEFGDRGWHPCFLCGETGKVSAETARAIQRQEEEAARPSEDPWVREELWSRDGGGLEWEDC